MYLNLEICFINKVNTVALWVFFSLLKGDGDMILNGMFLILFSLVIYFFQFHGIQVVRTPSKTVKGKKTLCFLVI